MWTRMKLAAVVVAAAVATGVLPIVTAAGESCPAKAINNGDCGIAGKWKNELNSTAIFTCSDGQLKGKYRSAVGAATDFYELSGRYTMSGPKKDVTVVGWVVAWNNSARGNSDSTTSWSGIYYPAEGVIYTQYILVSYVERKDMWESSTINHDEFTRDCPE